MKKILALLGITVTLGGGFVLLVAGIFMIAVASVASCTPAQRQTARDVRDVVLPVKALACIMGSLVTDARELTRICDVVDDALVPVVDNLIGFRDSGRRAGVVWRVTTDGGVVDADSSDAAGRNTW